MYAGLIATIVFGGIFLVSLLCFFICDENNESVMLATFTAGAASLAVIIAILFPVCLCNYLTSKKEYAKYLNTKESIELVVSNGNEVYNTSVANSVIEANNWVAEVKSSLETYGNFSMYYFIKDKEIEYIVINNDDSKNKE